MRSRLLSPSLAVLATLAVLAAGCRERAARTTEKLPRDAPAAPFVERAAELGLDFVHFNGRSGALYTVEVMGAGLALFDYDGDGDLDVYLVQGGMLGPGKTLADALDPPPTRLLPLTDRLYRNDLVPAADGRAEARFVDFTAASGITTASYGMGAAVADVDGDGHLDLYRTAWGANTLWRNRGDGTFFDDTARSGLAEDGWSASASFADYDADGHVDLYLTRYLHFDYGNHRDCRSPTSLLDYCSPAVYPRLSDRLFHNRGDGAFEDVSLASGVGLLAGPGLGVVALDLDDDGRLDFFVANDGSENFLWLSQPNGTFREQAVLAGVAANAAGRSEAGMGVDAADLDDDGDEELFLTHQQGETNTLYRSLGAGIFEDHGRASGLGAPSFPHTAFGTAFFDYDNDGRLDVLIANGDVRMRPELVAAGDPFPLHERNQLFRGLGGARFEEATDSAGPAFALSEVSRGAAFGDLDLDGDVDVVLSNNNGPARLLENRLGARAGWLGLDLEAGTRVEIETAPGERRHRRARRDGSYLSASDARIVIGLGARPAASLSVLVKTPRRPPLRLLGLEPGLRWTPRRDP